MKLLEITGKQIAYHLTTKTTISSVLRNGLTANNAARMGHVGDGIYIFFLEGRTINQASNMAEYLSLNDFALIETEVNQDTLLMDEDSLNDEDALYQFNQIHPELSVELTRLYESATDFRMAAIGFIEKHKIQPTSKMRTHFGHYSFLTARTIQQKLPVGRIWVWNPKIGMEEITTSQ